jgi:hypothetical protein
MVIKQYLPAVKTDKQGTTFVNREDTKWQKSSAGNIVLSIHALKQRKISAIFKLTMKNLSSPCHEKEICNNYMQKIFDNQNFIIRNTQLQIQNRVH